MTIIKYIITLILLLYSAMIWAQSDAPQWIWAQQAGGLGSDTGNAIVTDSSGDIYISGSFYNDASFGASYLQSTGMADIFVSKIDSEGNWQWASQAGGPGFDEARDIAIDQDKNTYICGEFSDYATFGAYTLVAAGAKDLFVAKADSSGNWIWAISAGGAYTEKGLGLCLDDEDNIYLTGYYDSSVYFGEMLLCGYGEDDIFVAKLDSDGQWLWATSAGGTGTDVGFAIQVFDEQSLYITGYFRDTAVFGSYVLTSRGDKDIFVAKLDTEGNWQWAQKAGGSGGDSACSMVLDSMGNICLTGRFSQVAGFGDITLSSSGEIDCFVGKIDADGHWLWASRAGGGDIDVSKALAIDQADNLYFAGYFAGAVMFGSAFFECLGFADIVIAALDSDGAWLWACRAGGSNLEVAYDIAVDSNANVYHTGLFWGTSGFGDDSLVSIEAADIYVSKLHWGTLSGWQQDLGPISSLGALYPNPMCSGEIVNVPYRVAERQMASLSLYNLRGQCIYNLDLFPGYGVIQLSTANLAPGLYFCLLKSQNTQIIRKLVVFR